MLDFLLNKDQRCVYYRTRTSHRRTRIFARSFCKEEFQKYGLETNIVQFNNSYNKRKGTLRGMHDQVPPFEEAKIVSCSQGSIYDVVVGLQKVSPDYCK
jgi:dTDP-4-dehydrorhamnose 3,5-epimerase